ncbi:MAG: 50S ribosomal protein L29 [Gammaproteobacteria bacterium]|nr:50S ribosomal protein L29 [Gammaproteobacteria bacterium]
MKAQELRDKTPAELQEELLALLREQLNLRMQKGGGEAPKPHHFKRVRRSIARIRTVLQEKGERA